MDRKSDRQVTLVNNDITYYWGSVPETKYANWVQMSAPKIKEDFSTDGFPFFVQIEPTNYCNLKCPICPAGGWGFKRNKRHMKLEEFKSIIDDMEKYLLFITLWDWGEPLLNPALPEMISYASERDIKTVVSTNCNSNFFHDEGYLERLLRSGLSTLILAVDSIHQDIYESYRGKGNIQKALQGIEKAVAMKKKLGKGPILMMRMVIMKQNEHEIRAMRNLARKIGADRFSVKTMNPLYTSESSDKDIVPQNPKYRRYQYKQGTYKRLKIPYKCDIIFRQCTIHSNGAVFPCCWWYDDDYATSNFFTDGGLTQIWNSPSYRDLRRKVLQDKDSFSYCQTCSFNYQFSRTGWFFETVNLTQGRIDQFKYLIKRHLELTMNPKVLNGLLQIRNKMKSFF
jgi:radical SAM protein with 4Fe4S-binding SPASM domain